MFLNENAFTSNFVKTKTISILNAAKISIHLSLPLSFYFSFSPSLSLSFSISLWLDYIFPFKAELFKDKSFIWRRVTFLVWTKNNSRRISFFHFVLFLATFPAHETNVETAFAKKSFLLFLFWPFRNIEKLSCPNRWKTFEQVCLKTN